MKKRSHSSGDIRETLYTPPPPEGGASDDPIGDGESELMKAFKKIQGNRKGPSGAILQSQLSAIAEEKDSVR